MFLLSQIGKAAVSPGLTIVGGNGQVAREHFNTPVPLTVQAADVSGKPIANLPLKWTVTSGSGNFAGAGAPDHTDANGQASVYFRGDVTPGYSWSQQTITVTSSVGTVNFVETATVSSVSGGGSASPPLVQLLNPPPENRKLSGPSGTVLRGAISINIVQVSGTQQGMPIPNVGMRIVNAQDPAATPAAQCTTQPLTDASGDAKCDLAITGPPGSYLLSAEVGEFVFTPGFLLTITSAPKCTFTATPANLQFNASGGVGNINVSTASGCSWTASSNASWISVTSGSSGSGYGGASITVAANTGPARTGGATVAGQTITVSQAAASSGNSTFSIVTAALPSAVTGSGYTASLAATGGTAPYSWSTTATLPAGLTLNPTTGSITGTATVAGSYTLPVTVRDAAGLTQNRTLVLTVVASGGQPSPPSITNSGFPAGSVGKAYQEVLNSVGGCAGMFSAPPVYTLSGGSLPAGLNVILLDNLRQYAISGTPTQAGTFNFTITVTDSCGGSGSSNFSITIGGTSTNPGSLTITPASLTFATAAGGNPAADQTVTVSGPVGTTFTASAAAGGGWLSLVGPVSGSLPITLTVRASSAGGFPAGTYNGTITVSSSAGTKSIPVTVTASGPAAVLAPSPSAVDASVLTGESKVQQTLTVTNASGPAHFAVYTTIVNGSGWLSVTPNSGDTPGSLTVVLDPAGLGPSTYIGSIQLMPTSPAGSPISVPVTFRVLPPTSLAAAPDALSFVVAPGQPLTAAQTLKIASAGVSVDTAVSATTKSGGTWLFVSPVRASTPLEATVSVNPTGLPAGTYQGSIVVASGTQALTPVTVPVTLTVAQSAPSIAGILNAASYRGSVVSPGEIVTIFGSGMGPSGLVASRLTSQGTLDNKLGGTTVTFDGVPAPLIYSRSDQISAIAPYSLDGRASTQVQVGFEGLLSSPMTVQVAPSAPAIFTASASGTGPAAALNEDGGYNTASSGAAPGSIVVLYATGEGQTNPTGIDGLLANSATLPKPLLTPTVTIGGLEAEVVYAGAAPTFAAGLMQINVRVPDAAPKGAAVPVVLNIGNGASQPGVTIFTQ